MSQAICMDLYSDWIALLRAELIERGYDVPKDEPQLSVALKCFNARLRTIEARPRVVHKARSLDIGARHEAALDKIQAIAERGGDLTPFSSKRLLDVHYHDPLLNDWGLHHLHLGAELDQTGFVARTSSLLFARVTPAAFYMVSVKDHSAWSDLELLETVLADWPELLEPLEVRGVQGDTLTPSQWRAVRKKNVQVVPRLSNGRAYAPMGGGSMASGVNGMLVTQHDYIRHVLQFMEDDIRTNIEAKRTQLPSCRTFGSPPTFKLAIVNDDPVAVEVTAGHGYQYRWR